MFELSFSILTIVLLVLGVSAFVFAAFAGVKPFADAAHAVSSTSDDGESYVSKLPKASVVVYSHKAEGVIREYLERLLSQDYPDFEVIVVNDYVVDDMTQEIVEDMAKSHENLHITYVPQDSRNVSRRKLAITLGIKAAKGDVVVTTSSIAKIGSDKWLVRMMRGFANPRTDVVLGYTQIAKSSMRGAGKWYRSFDSLSEACSWISAAAKGRTYRGDGLNLAYRKSVFFANKGFAGTVHLQNGEDDLFISQISTPMNTCLELSEESRLTVDCAVPEKRMWLDMKERYAFTSHYLKTSARTMQRLCGLLLWLGLAALTAVSVMSLPNVVPALASVVILCGFFTYLIICYRRAATMLGAIRLWWSLPLFMFVRPIVDVVYRLVFNTRKSRNFTWQRRKV